MKLIPIVPEHTHTEAFPSTPELQVHVEMMRDYYQKVGYNPPWIGYIAKEKGTPVGSAAFKGKPQAHTVEIAYTTLPDFRKQGYGKKICRRLVELALQTYPDLGIIARTLPETNASTKILIANCFQYIGTIWDEEDGTVWEWKYVPDWHAKSDAEKAPLKSSLQ